MNLNFEKDEINISNWKEQYEMISESKMSNEIKSHLKTILNKTKKVCLKVLGLGRIFHSENSFI
jgi:hypothetical protein